MGLAFRLKKESEPKPGNPEAPIVFDMPAMTIAGEVAGERVSNPDKQGDWLAIAYGGDGALGAIWIEWNDKDPDRVLVSRKPAHGAWQPPITATISNSGTVSAPQRLTTAPSADFNARAAANAAGDVTVVWQSFRNLPSDVFARRYRSLDLVGRLSDRQLRRLSP